MLILFSILCKQWLISEGNYSDPNNDERAAKVGSKEKTGVNSVDCVNNVGNSVGASDGLRVGASSYLSETSCVATRSDASGAVSSRRRYCVVM